MKLLFIFVGLLGGIAGGMGMGGGTILIPLLNIFLNIAQKEAQLFNVFSFILMAGFIVFIHIKNKLINVFPALVFSVIGSFFAVITAFFVKDIPSSKLQIFFGIFLIILAVIQIFALLVKKNKSN